MTKIIIKQLPHAISYTDVKDPLTRQKIMLLIENINSLKIQLSEAQKAIIELQRR